MPIPLPGYRDIVDLLKKGATIEAQEKIMELREAALTLQEENFTLREQLKKLEAELGKQKSVRFENRVYYVEGDPIPHCPYCYDSQKKLIHFTGPDPTSGGSVVRCSHCGSIFFRGDGESEFSFYSGPRREKH